MLLKPRMAVTLTPDFFVSFLLSDVFYDDRPLGHTFSIPPPSFKSVPLFPPLFSFPQGIFGGGGRRFLPKRCSFACTPGHSGRLRFSSTISIFFPRIYLLPPSANYMFTSHGDLSSALSSENSLIAQPIEHLLVLGRAAPFFFFMQILLRVFPNRAGAPLQTSPLSARSVLRPPRCAGN